MPELFIGCAIYTCNGVMLVLTKLLNKQWYNVTNEAKYLREIRMVFKNFLAKLRLVSPYIVWLQKAILLCLFFGTKG